MAAKHLVMAESSNKSTAKIVRAAGQLFARQGYHATSTREIARLADVSENTLFRHFEHKEDLFWAALEANLSELQLRRGLVQGIRDLEAPEVVIPQLLDLFVETITLRPELLRLLAVGFLEMRWKAESVLRNHFAPMFLALRQYLAANVERGRVRNLDPAMLMASLTMSVMVHRELSRVFLGEQPMHSDAREAAKAYAKFWLDLLAPSATDHARMSAQVFGVAAL